MSRSRGLLLGLALLVLVSAAVTLFVVHRRDDSGGGGEEPEAAPTWSGPVEKADFQIATFNVLGASHTAPGGDKPDLASGADRLREAMDLLRRHQLSLIGFQELQTSQEQAFRRLTGSRWGIFHAPGDTENSVAWRTDTWALVRSRVLWVPYFYNDRPMPVVVLRHRDSGRRIVIVDIHNPASVVGDRKAQRAEAVRRERALVGRLTAAGLPVIVLGDFNDHIESFCALTRGGLMHSASGGTAAPCTPPEPERIDWIFGNDRVRFSDYVLDTRTRDEGYSDHYLILAQGRLVAKPAA